MSRPPDPDAPLATAPWLGTAVRRRFRMPGPPVGRPLPSRIGTLTSAVSRGLCWLEKDASLCCTEILHD